jgi:hypothetical protein
MQRKGFIFLEEKKINGVSLWTLGKRGFIKTLKHIL